jgi:hypothetical protein
MRQPLMTKERLRTHVCGSWESDGAAAVVNVRGDGAVLRTGAGVVTVTFEKDMGTLVSSHAGMDANTGDQIVRDPVATVVAGVTVLTITTIDISGAAAADTNGPRVNWSAVFCGKFSG